MPDVDASLITPDAKLGALLERWPGVEAALLEISPHFRALQNPVLRRTVARVATLRQVSKVSGVPLGVLIERLRAAAGLPPLAVTEEADGGQGERPAWAADAAVTRTHDARPSIEAGEHPMAQVMANLAALREDEVYVLVTPFVPAPLLDLARDKGYLGHSVAVAEGQVRTYFHRSTAGSPL